MGFRAFFLIYFILICGGVAFADVVVENTSNDSINVSAVFGNCCIDPTTNDCVPCGTDLPSPTPDGLILPEANGFWSIAPKSNAILYRGKYPHKDLWIRVVVKPAMGRGYELFPVGATRIRIDRNGCYWTNSTPSYYICKAMQRFAPTSTHGFSVSLGSASSTNSLRSHILEGRSYEFFQVKPQANGSFKWTWK